MKAHEIMPVGAPEEKKPSAETEPVPPESEEARLEEEGALEERQRIEDRRFIEGITCQRYFDDVETQFRRLDADRRHRLLNSPEMREAAKVIVQNQLKHNQVEGVRLAIAFFNMTAEDFETAEMRGSVVSFCIRELRFGDHVGTFRVMNITGLSEDLLSEEEFVAAAMAGIDRLLSGQSNPIGYATKMANAYADKGLGHLVHMKR